MSKENILLDDDYNSFNNEIINSVYKAYALALYERRKRGSSYKGFSRDDYDFYKKEDDPTSRQIVYYCGGWKNIQRILPGDLVGKRDRIDLSHITIENFYHILSSISEENDTLPSSITLKQFNEYRDENPSVHSWLTYAKHLHCKNWKELVNYVCVENYKKELRL